MIVCFSGTGNSRYCAEFFADRLGDALTDSFHFIRGGVAAEFISERPWVFVSPTYAWQIPRVFAGFIRGGSFSGSRDAYFVMTCGSDIGNAEKLNRALCAEKGFIFKGTLQVVMPENYIAMYDAPGPEETVKIVNGAFPTLKAGAARVSGGLDFPSWKRGIIDRLKSGVVNDAFYRYFVKSNKFAASDACVSCGRCAEVCVTNNISFIDGRPVWGGQCTHCMACICGCPVSAIEYGKISAGKPRYKCPEYERGGNDE